MLITLLNNILPYQKKMYFWSVKNKGNNATQLNINYKTMTKTALNKLERKAKIKHNEYDYINSYVNQKGTKIITRFYIYENIGDVKTYFERGFASTNLLSVCKREENYNDYLTKGIEDKCYMILN